MAGDADIIALFGDDAASDAFRRWEERLRDYIGDRAIVAPLRQRTMPDAPWPSQQNVMLGYLIDRAREIEESGSLDEALVWLAVHAWFEGALDTRFGVVREALGENDPS